jgi:hypothetical protein
MLDFPKESRHGFRALNLLAFLKVRQSLTALSATSGKNLSPDRKMLFRPLLLLPLLLLAGALSAGWIQAQEYATDRLFLKEHFKTNCRNKVQREVEEELERPQFTGEHQRMMELDAWNRKRKGIPLSYGQQHRLRQMLQGTPPPRLPTQKDVNREKAYRNRALERQC